MSKSLPNNVISNPRFVTWLNFETKGKVRVATGKVEIGQGITTALSQIAAEELDLTLDQITMLSGRSDLGPNERYTSSSLSIMDSGAAIRVICADARSLLLARAALRLNCAADQLSVDKGRIFIDGSESDVTYWTVADEIDWSQEATGEAIAKAPESYKIVGTDVPRGDLKAKVGGGSFIHDWLPKDVLHARILRQPSRDALLHSLDERALRRAVTGDFEVHRRDNFIAFLSEDELTVELVSEVAMSDAIWSGVKEFEPVQQEANWLRHQPSIDKTHGDVVAANSTGEIIRATFSRAYVAHASIAPSCALARFENEKLTVWSHGQGMHPLRQNIASVVGLPESDVTALHMFGAGCYGHNGADDVAMDASLLAIAYPGRHVRVQWRRAEEFSYEPLGPAMLMDLTVEVDKQGWPVDWTAEIWSPTHVQRPSAESGALLAAYALSGARSPQEPDDPSEERGGGGTRNAKPYYDVPRSRILHHLIKKPPVRTSALRTLGALPNIFALEAMIDDLAKRCGKDPLDYRLALLSDERARYVLSSVAAKANWQDRESGGDGKGLGLAFSRYKNTAAYAAVAVALRVDEKVNLEKIWVVADAGLVINPDGLRNQLEGGAIQGSSWALKEQVSLDASGISSLDWDTYPILRFSEVPEIETDIIDRPKEPSLGVGECAVSPTAAAIGNGVAHALGRRINHMPLSRERILSELLERH